MCPLRSLQRRPPTCSNSSPRIAELPGTTIEAKPCVNITVRNAYGEPLGFVIVGGGNQESSAGRSTAGKSTITMPIINGITKPQRRVLSVNFSGSVNFYPFSHITFGQVNKFNPRAIITSRFQIEHSSVLDFEARDQTGSLDV